jgi:hypothetical protein
MSLGDFLHDVGNLASILTDNGDAGAFTYHDYGDLIYDIARRTWIALYIYNPGYLGRQLKQQNMQIQDQYGLRTKLVRSQQKKNQIKQSVKAAKKGGNKKLDWKKELGRTIMEAAGLGSLGKSIFGPRPHAEVQQENEFISIVGGTAWVQDVSYSFQQQMTPLFHTGAQTYTNMSLPFFQGSVTFRKLYYIQLINEDGSNKLPENWDLVFGDYFGAPNPFVRGLFIKAIDDSDAKLISQAITDYTNQFGGGLLGVVKKVVKGLVGRVMSALDQVFPVSKVLKGIGYLFDGSWEAELESLMGNIPRGEIYIGKPLGYSMATQAGHPFAFETVSIAVEKMLPPPRINKGPLYRNKLLHEIMQFI